MCDLMVVQVDGHYVLLQLVMLPLLLVNFLNHVAEWITLITACGLPYLVIWLYE